MIHKSTDTPSLLRTSYHTQHARAFGWQVLELVSSVSSCRVDQIMASQQVFAAQHMAGVAPYCHLLDFLG